MNFFVSDIKKLSQPKQTNPRKPKFSKLITNHTTTVFSIMSTYTIEQVQAAIEAPVEIVEGPRQAKVAATVRMATTAAIADAVKARKTRLAAEKREAREQRKLDRIAKKAQKADKANKRKTKVVKPMTTVANAAAKAAKTRRKSLVAQKKAHSAFKRELKPPRRKLMTGWKEEAKAKKELAKAAKAATPTKRNAKKAQLRAELAELGVGTNIDTVVGLRKVLADRKKELKAKAATPKRTKLTDEQKLANKAKRAYQTEMNRRAKWEREFQGKFGADFLSYAENSTKSVSEDPEIEDGFVC